MLLRKFVKKTIPRKFNNGYVNPVQNYNSKKSKMISLSTCRPKFKVGSSKSLNLKKRPFSFVKERPGD